MSSRFSSHLRRPRLSQQLELLVAVASPPSRCRRVSLPFLLFAFSSPAPTQSWSCSLTLAHPSHCRRLVAVSSPPSTRSHRLAQPPRLQWRVSADLLLFGFWSPVCADRLPRQLSGVGSPCAAFSSSQSIAAVRSPVWTFWCDAAPYCALALTAYCALLCLGVFWHMSARIWPSPQSWCGRRGPLSECGVASPMGVPSEAIQK